jgi:hypothetical protein
MKEPITIERQARAETPARKVWPVFACFRLFSRTGQSNALQVTWALKLGLRQPPHPCPHASKSERQWLTGTVPTALWYGLKQAPTSMTY